MVAEIIPVEQEQGEFEGLLFLAKSGDEGAFKEIVAPHMRLLRWTARQRLYNSEDVEDCVQRALVKCWQALSHYEPGGYGMKSWRRYLVVTTERMAYDQMDKITRRTPKGGFVRSWQTDAADDTVLFQDETVTVVVPEKSFEDDLVSEFAAETLRKWLNTILRRAPIRQAAAFKLIAFDKLTMEQAAVRMTEKFGQPTSKGAIKSLLFAARTFIREQWGDYEAWAVNEEKRARKRKWRQQSDEAYKESRRQRMERIKADPVAYARFKEMRLKASKRWRDQNRDRQAKASLDWYRRFAAAEERRQQMAEKQRLYRIREKNDPVKLEHRRKRDREAARRLLAKRKAEADPRYFENRKRENERRKKYVERVMADPEKRAEFNAKRREWSRKKRERERAS